MFSSKGLTKKGAAASKKDLEAEVDADLGYVTATADGMSTTSTTGSFPSVATETPATLQTTTAAVSVPAQQMISMKPRSMTKLVKKNASGGSKTPTPTTPKVNITDEEFEAEIEYIEVEVTDSSDVTEIVEEEEEEEDEEAEEEEEEVIIYDINDTSDDSIFDNSNDTHNYDDNSSTKFLDVNHITVNELPKTSEDAFLPPPNEIEAVSWLNEMQTKAVEYVVRQSKKESQVVYPDLLVRVNRLSYDEKDLKRLLRYIRDEAPLIIHFQADVVLKFFVKDTHYRNQFETQTSRGTLDNHVRVQWENRMFNNIYHRDCPGFDRCKYGVLNVVNDPMGIRACYHYGDSYLKLKNVRLRTSFAPNDSSLEGTKLACCEYYCHVLQQYSDEELKAVLEVATGKKTHHDSGVIRTYKEVQYHGEIRLDRDVAEVVINKRHQNDNQIKWLMKEYEKKHKVKVSFMQ